MTGLDLKVRRVAAEVRSKELAEAMGVHPSRITHIETTRTLTADTIHRYLAALATCTTKSTDVA
jgi:plasmid maintenance system antidote protein VapI